MSNSFAVTNCFYDGTSGDPNPICYVQGTVNGKNVWYAPAFFRYLMAANAAGQMQEALTPAMFNYYVSAYGPMLAPIPEFLPVPRFRAVRCDRNKFTGNLSGLAGCRVQRYQQGYNSDAIKIQFRRNQP